MAKLTLTQKPTFKAVVQIPVLGGTTEPVEFTFKAKRKTEFAEWLKALTSPDGDTSKEESIVLEIASGWDLEDQFNKENLMELGELYPGATRAIVTAYINEYTGAKAGN